MIQHVEERTGLSFWHSFFHATWQLDVKQKGQKVQSRREYMVTYLQAEVHLVFHCLIARPWLRPALAHNGLRQKRREHGRVLVLVQERYWITGHEHRVRRV